MSNGKHSTASTAPVDVAVRALSAAHGFDVLAVKGKAGALSVARKLNVIQSDPLDVAGRNHDFTLFARVSGYRRHHLDELLYKDRALFEYYCKMASIMPVETYPVFQYMRGHFAKKYKPFFKEHAKETKEILSALERAPVCSNDFESEKKVDYWGKTQVYRVILERLFISGRTVIHHRTTGIKYYTLVEKAIPKKILEDDSYGREEYHRAATLMIARASRLVSPSKAVEQWHAVGKTKEITTILKGLEREGELASLEVEGWKGVLYIPSKDEDIWRDPPEPGEDWARFLAPLDPVLWNRALFEAIHGHRYCWEVYKKADERKYGYYSLPVLYNGKCTALIEPYYRKKDKALEIRSFHILDNNVDKIRFKAALKEELKRFYEYSGAERMENKSAAKWISSKG
ncbi:MAG: YcaQ family DNA glycosylase [Euryarchaeota archaeon]|nr:YcaQ family DNA glycosylase [Euryarchaeota archaeon]